MVLNLDCMLESLGKVFCFCFLMLTGASQVTLVVKNLPANVGDTRESGSKAGSERSPGKKKMAIHSLFLPRKSHEQRSLVGYSPWGYRELDTTKQLNTHTVLVKSESLGMEPSTSQMTKHLSLPRTKAFPGA